MNFYRYRLRQILHYQPLGDNLGTNLEKYRKSGRRHLKSKRKILVEMIRKKKNQLRKHKMDVSMKSITYWHERLNVYAKYKCLSDNIWQDTDTTYNKKLCSPYIIRFWNKIFALDVIYESRETKCRARAIHLPQDVPSSRHISKQVSLFRRSKK